jgi:hypothetical protein
MIVDDLNIFRLAFAPDEADSPLIVDPNTVLTLPVAAQSLKPISWNCRHVLQFPGIVQHPKLPPRHRSDVVESAASLALKKSRGLLTTEGPYHTDSIPRLPLNVP